MSLREAVRAVPGGVGFAVASALLFGLSTPFAKLLVGEMPPILLAGLLYAGSGLGLFLLRLLVPASVDEAPIKRADVPWLAGAVVAGGILGPILLLSGLRSTPASSASLLLNLEGVFTALLAWFVFHENFDRRIALGFALIMAGGASAIAGRVAILEAGRVIQCGSVEDLKAAPATPFVQALIDDCGEAGPGILTKESGKRQ